MFGPLLTMGKCWCGDYSKMNKLGLYSVLGCLGFLWSCLVFSSVTMKFSVSVPIWLLAVFLDLKINGRNHHHVCHFYFSMSANTSFSFSAIWLERKATVWPPCRVPWPMLSPCTKEELTFLQASPFEKGKDKSMLDADNKHFVDLLCKVSWMECNGHSQRTKKIWYEDGAKSCNVPGLLKTCAHKTKPIWLTSLVSLFVSCLYAFPLKLKMHMKTGGWKCTSVTHCTPTPNMTDCK